MAMTYPSEPWHLRGQMYLSMWLLPRARLPELPAGMATLARPVMIAGRAVVGTAWVRYQPGGMLQYRELLSALLIRIDGRPAVSIAHIWVDSEASRSGGRQLWGIPKELATFDFPEASDAPQMADFCATPPEQAMVRAAAAASDGSPLAEARFRARLGIPGRWRFRFAVTQMRAEQVVSTPVCGSTGVRIGSAQWRPDPTGPLAYLAGRRPWLTMWLTNFRLTFGRAPEGGTGRAS